MDNIYFEEHGKGEPLLLIAGLSSDSQSWLTIVAALAKHFHVIIFDNRGIGRSPKDNTNISIQKMTDDCVHLIKHLKLSSVNILGHSMGGMIAMNLAIKHPKLVHKLILEASSPKLSMRNVELFQDWVSYLKSGMDKELWFRNIFYWIFSPAFFDNKKMLEKAVELSINYPYPQSDESFANQVKALQNFNAISEIAKIKAPTLLMHGELDLLFPEADSKDLYESIPDSVSVTIPNAAHSIHIDNSDYFLRTLLDFLNPKRTID